MSAVKAVRELKGSEEWTSGEGIAAAAGLDICVEATAQDEGSGDWWAARATSVRAWMDANPLRLGIPGDGSLALIQAQLERGNEFEGVRRRCWAHIEMELKELPGWDVEQSKPDGTFFKPRELAKMEDPPPIPAEPAKDSGSVVRPCLADFPPPSPEVFQSQEPGAAAFMPEAFGAPLPVTTEAAEPVEAPVDDAPVPAAPAEAAPAEVPPEEPRKPLSQMTMLERQKHWMDKKKQKVEAERLEKEKENQNFSFKPNTASSKRTFKPMDPKPAPPAPQAANGPNAPASGQASEKATASKSKAGSRWQKVKSNIKDIKGSASKRKAPSKPKVVDAVPGKTENQKPEPPLEPRTRLSARRQEEAEAAAGEERPETTEADTDVTSTSDDAQGPVGAEDERQVDQQGEPTEAGADAPEKAEPAVPFVPGQFWYKIEAGRGYHRVQDGAGCQMWSMYRRKDKSRNLSGVSLLVGRLEKPPYDEQVIQMIFDTDHWTEEQAFGWWGDNEYRYTSCSDSGKLLVAPLARNPPATKPGDLSSAVTLLKT